MKKLLLFGLLLSGLASCSKNSEPAPTPVTTTAKITDGRWEWESESLVSVFKNGQPTTTQNKTVVPGSVYFTYGTNGLVTSTINGVAQTPVAYTTYQVGVPVVTTNKGFTVTTTLTELTSTHMTQVEVDEDNTVKYTTTDTFKR